MKKFFSMMLTVCAVATFSACSSDDGPTNPVSNANVPASAKIGSEVTIQGSGFAADQTLLLQPVAGDPVDTKAKMTSNGATFTIPYTMSVGSVDVVLKAAEASWVLGRMELLEAENPITALSLPSKAALGQDVMISGIGFAEGDKLSLGATVKADASAVEITLTSDGVKFSSPADLAEGEYDVTLTRGSFSWKLGSILFYQLRSIESITISENQMLTGYAPMLGLEGGVLTLNFEYNEDGSIKAIGSNGYLEYGFQYEGKVVVTANPLTGQPLSYTLDDSGRVATSVGYDMYGDVINYKWNYDADGYLLSVKKDGGKDDDDTNLLFTYKDSNVSGYRLSMDNELKTDKRILACPYTIDPAILVNCFWWIQSRCDLFLGFVLNLSKNVNISAYVPNVFVASDSDPNDQKPTSNSVSIANSFENNKLTMETTGGVISNDQGLLTNKVVVTYKNK